jgi:hypothetical protein
MYQYPLSAQILLRNQNMQNQKENMDKNMYFSDNRNKNNNFNGVFIKS